MGKNVGYSSWINRKNKRHRRIIQNMVVEVFIDTNQHKNKWCRVAGTSDEVCRYKIQSVLDNNSPRFEWYIKGPVLMNSEHLNITSTQLHHHIKI